MDLVVFLVLLCIVIFFFRRFSSFIYFIVIADILLRIVTFIKIQLTTGEIFSVLNKYVPADIPTILGNYSSGLFYNILLWFYVVIYIIFEFYIIRTFFRKK